MIRLFRPVGRNAVLDLRERELAHHPPGDPQPLSLRKSDDQDRLPKANPIIRRKQDGRSGEAGNPEEGEIQRVACSLTDHRCRKLAARGVRSAKAHEDRGLTPPGKRVRGRQDIGHRLGVLSGGPGGDDDSGGERHEASIPLDRNLDAAGDHPFDHILTGTRDRLQVCRTWRELRTSKSEQQDGGPH